MLFSRIIEGTPFYVWIILLVLYKRGKSAAKDGAISFEKMFIMPLIFIVWGLEKMFVRFGYLEISLMVYAVTACFGAIISFGLYSRYRQVYMKDKVFYRTGTYLSLVIMLVNFFVKYLMNVGMAIQPSLYMDLNFNIFYSIAAGFSVGLFVGGILQTIKACTVYKEGLNTF